jgi:small conductance mechanosensitive channel
MNGSTPNFIAAAGDTWQALIALVVAYSFSALGAILILVIGWLIAGLAERWSYRAMNAFGHVDETVKRFLSKSLRYGVLILVGITVLSQFGVQTTSIIATLGAAGLAVGLALQGTLQNIAAGLMLLFLRPFRVGEYIETSSIAGTIRDVGLFATELQTKEGIYVLAPNSSLWNTPVKNFTRNATRRTELSVKIGSETNLEEAQAILHGLLDADPRVINDPEPAVYVSELSGAGLTLTARYWTATRDFTTARFDLNRALEEALRNKGITIK